MTSHKARPTLSMRFLLLMIGYIAITLAVRAGAIQEQVIWLGA